jgi:hypothetical protein
MARANVYSHEWPATDFVEFPDMGNSHSHVQLKYESGSDFKMGTYHNVANS